MHLNKECALAHSRAERGRLRHTTSSRECASYFYLIGISYQVKKAALNELLLFISIPEDAGSCILTPSLC